MNWGDCRDSLLKTGCCVTVTVRRVFVVRDDVHVQYFMRVGHDDRLQVV